ncbi:MAG: TetR/AcrR family transcriptional regulator [Bacteroidaceae bacterium]|nr:TetR/AcrR family transcriptional regulator [Bacteroidaceae bacterium]
MEQTRTKEEHTKEEVHMLITEKALELFTQKGIKDVKMDDIASILSMSKRTIYEQFADKEQLLLEALKLHNKRMRDKTREKIREAKHVLDIVLTMYTMYFESIKSVNIKFFKELERYPNICKRNTERDQKNDKKFLAWMEMGRRQGFFREDANFEILLYILRRDLQAIFTANMKDEKNELSKYTPDELGRTLILFYLRGISTPRGQEIIEDYMKNNKIS